MLISCYYTVGCNLATSGAGGVQTKGVHVCTVVPEVQPCQTKKTTIHSAAFGSKASKRVDMLQTIIDQSYDDSLDVTVALAPSPEPKAKRHKAAESPKSPTSPDYSNEEIPTKFSTKWLTTAKGLLAFVKNEDSGTIHCGWTRMRMLALPATSTGTFGEKITTWDERAIICMSGCESADSKCQGRPNLGGMCECHCHILQEHYDSRIARNN